MNISIFQPDIEGLINSLEDSFGKDFAQTSENVRKYALRVRESVNNHLFEQKKIAADAKILAEQWNKLSDNEQERCAEFLDEMVHDTASAGGSAVNNDGKESQFAYLLNHYSFDELNKMLQFDDMGRPRVTV